MFQAKGCSVWGTKDKLDQSALEKLTNKTLVFDLTKSGGDVPQSFTTIKADISLNKFSEGVESIVAGLKDESETTNCVVLGDSIEDVTAGMAVACLTKSVQTIKKMKEMVAAGISEKEWMEKLIKKSFEEGGEVEVDEYDVVRALLNKLPNGQLGKILSDKVVDFCDDKLNLRDCILKLKDNYDTAGELNETKLKTIEALERYFYIVCVGAYVRSEGEDGYKKTFSSWTKELPCIQEYRENGIRFWKDMTFFSLAPKSRSSA